MVFGRVLFGCVIIGHVQFGRALNRMSVSHLSVWSRLYKPIFLLGVTKLTGVKLTFYLRRNQTAGDQLSHDQRACDQRPWHRFGEYQYKRYDEFWNQIYRNFSVSSVQ